MKRTLLILCASLLSVSAFADHLPCQVLQGTLVCPQTGLGQCQNLQGTIICPTPDPQRGCQTFQGVVVCPKVPAECNVFSGQIVCPDNVTGLDQE